MSALRAYCTLAQLRTRQQLAATDTSDDPRLLAKIRAASAEIERFTGRVFQPILEARTFDYQDSLSLTFRGQDLLTLTTLVDGAGVTIAPSAIILKGATQSGNTANGPFYGLELDPTKAFLLYITTKTRAISVTGIWGWHDDYPNAWIASTLTVSGSLDAVSTTIPTSANPTTTADAWGQSPGISAGALVQVDSEW